jgi:hypothetical protein
VIDVDNHGPDKEIALTLYWSGTYTNNPAGDPLDLSPANNANPDTTSRNPQFLPGASPSSQPKTWSDNGGDMGNGAYIGIVVGADIHSWRIRFYQANGTELATNAAYPAGTPTAAAASNVMIFIAGKLGKF